MTALKWVNTRPFSYDTFTLQAPADLTPVISSSAGVNQQVGIRPNSARQLRLKRLAWPFVSFTNQWFVTGFLERILGRWMRDHMSPTDPFLEIGAGDLGLRRFLPRGSVYNAIDIAYSEFTLRRVLPRAAKRGQHLNLALASVNHIPLADSSVAFSASKEVFMYPPDIPAALREVFRVTRPNGYFACTIGNLYCTKYQRKGLQPDFRSPFHFDEFRLAAESVGFRCIHAIQKGWWVPLPLWLCKTTYQLPFTSSQENNNTNFLYLFQAVK
ncbi:MAG TPA: class I SAM-dependent methyltransferase [Phycisphaerales bacterium]|nr:class I SAM-dependent methyltransferase [Phycisphaerales bacterium]